MTKGDVLRLIARAEIQKKQRIQEAELNILAQEKGGFVYLMFDAVFKVYKIGFSKQPAYRERTLQAERPVINLIAKWPAPRIAEKALHEMFAAKRVRGEWFRLSATDLITIERFFNGKSATS